MRSLILFLCFISFFSQATCLQNGDITTLTGILVYKTYPSLGDESESVNRWIIQLDKPLECVVDIDKSFPNWNKDITIFPPHSGLSSNLINKHVTASGKLTLAFTANHFTAVLLLSSKLEKTSEK
ncbi:DUF4431 domain-containing protein [Buttiauxella sp.]|uniref:DUF4431 domain-containing protein n=1 Tax=Buttiauxella sp. TaxID=1972222 RepID=UPI003C75E7C4